VIVYLDTSTLLRVLFGQAPILAVWGTWERSYASELAGVEARRAKPQPLLVRRPLP
jgi:hypothetical protein